MNLHLAPISLRQARAYVATEHRHHKAPQGGKFAISACDAEGVCHGVVIVGRPVARLLDDGFTAEVVRLATDGTPNACSMLYAAAWRAARAMGYLKLITYILEHEPGTALRASGWVEVAATRGGSWHRPSRARVDSHPLDRKRRWEVAA